MTDEPLLLELLRNVQISALHLNYDFNLGKSFLDEIADFVTLENLSSYESLWNRASDLSVIDRLNVRFVYLAFEQLPREMAGCLLKNPSCLYISFSYYSGFDEWEIDGKFSKTPAKSQAVIRGDSWYFTGELVRISK